MDANHYKKILLERKEDLSSRISKIDRDIRHEGMTADWSEQASERENDEVLESLGISSEQELLMINYALKRIDSGTYFHCDECGEEIPVARLDLLPKQQANPGYFEHYKFRVYHSQDGNKTEISPESVDWQAMSKEYFPYSLVQEPGNKNALGKLKFILPNPWKIYLHDTPSKSLFDHSQRNFSAGCIRVEDPLALASFSLSRNSKQQPLLDIISSNEIYSAKLDQPLSVYAIYATVWLNGDEIVFSPDSYRRDQRMSEYL